MLSKRQLSRYGTVLLAVTLIMLLSGASWGQSISREQAMIAARQLSTAFAMVASQVKPAVVNISTTTIIPGRQSPFSSLFPEFGWLFQTPDREVTSLGSGFFISTDGYIVTNHHVIGEAQQITVKLADGREFSAELQATDPPTDLAVIKVPAEGLPYLQWGDSQQLQIGEWVLAVGSPLGLSQTVTAGIISAIGRSGLGLTSYEDFIQTDAAVNPGNSGGPLVNIAGQVVGINTAIASKSGGSEGISFAVPSNIAAPVCQQLISKGTVSRGWLGIIPRDVTPAVARHFGLDINQGVLVYQLYRNSPAFDAGIVPGDVLSTWNGEPITAVSSLSKLVADTTPGTMVPIAVWADGESRTVTVTLGQRPPAEGRMSRGI